jgi:hypothetical protein
MFRFRFMYTLARFSLGNKYPTKALRGACTWHAPRSLNFSWI